MVGNDKPSQEVIACDKLMVTPGAIDDKLTGDLSVMMEDLSKVKDAVGLTNLWPVQGSSTIPRHLYIKRKNYFHSQS